MISMPMFRFWLGALLLIAIGATAHANPVRDLHEEGHLTVSTSVTPERGAVPGEKVRLLIEIATDTWFTGGTRIALPEVAGLVVLQNEQFASNATENRAGTTWVVQRWSLDVFAQQAGEFKIPPIRLSIKVNGGARGDVEGDLYSPSTPLKIVVPEALADVPRFVAAPDFSVSQGFDRDLQSLAAGDAVQWQVEFHASDVMAMMLPEIAAPQFDGLAAYPAPPALENSNNRGQASAKRIETISFVAERAGTYELPEREFFWWNTDTQELETLTLDAQTLVVTGGGVAAQDKTVDRTTLRDYLKLAGSLLAITAVIYAVAVSASRLPWRATIEAGQKAIRWLRALTRPALPTRLNPDNSAAD